MFVWFLFFILQISNNNPTLIRYESGFLEKITPLAIKDFGDFTRFLDSDAFNRVGVVSQKKTITFLFS